MNKLDIRGHGCSNVLILHGWGQNTTLSWERFMRLCKNDKQFKWMFLKLPGLDFKLERPLDTKDYAQYVIDTLQRAKIKPDFILAHSFGCQITTHILAHNFLKPSKVMYLGAAGLPYQLTLFERFKQKVSCSFNFLKKIPFLYKFGRRILSSKDYQSIQDPLLRQTFQNVIQKDQTKLLKTIVTPIHLVFGSKDTYTPLYMAKQMRGLLKLSKLTIIRGANHGLHIHHPNRIYELSRKFYLSS